MKISSISSINLNQRLNNNNKSENTNYNKNSFHTVNFGTTSRVNTVIKPAPVDKETAEFVVKSLSTSTSGHRGTYMSKAFNPEIVKILSLGVAEYAKNKNIKTILIGGDTRLASRESLPKIKNTLIKQGINVINITEPVPTPLLALASKKLGTDIAILMTASHNPWKDGGFNLVTSEGAIAPSEITKQVAKHILNISNKGTYDEDLIPTGSSVDFNPYDMYVNELENLKLINFNKIRDSKVKIFYDGLQGTGVYVMPKLYNQYGIPITELTSSGQEGPNPTDVNLKVLKEALSKSNSKLQIGLANDGDADRFGIVDENGQFIDPNDVLLLVGYHLTKNKRIKGDIVRSHATSMQIDKLANRYGTKVFVTPVGFKYIGEDIMNIRKNNGDILVAGEESGGLTVHGHIPEKDGIIATSLIADLVATEKKPLSIILKEAKESLGTSFAINNFSKKYKDEEVKNAIINRVCSMWNDAVKNGHDKFDSSHRIDIEKTVKADDNIRSYRPIGDGYKFVFTDGSTVLIRKSGTEPLVRCYVETVGKNQDEAERNSNALKLSAEEILKP